MPGVNMMEIGPNIYWEVTTENSVVDMSFNFPVNTLGGGISEDDDYHQQTMKRKISISRDPMSHRIIEKRRRDRMNNCLADLSRLIPLEYMKKGRGRIEKTEIIEMAIQHIKHLQTSKELSEVNDPPGDFINDKQFVNGAKVVSDHELSPQEHYKLGYQECVAETMRYLVELQGFSPGEALCVKLISHLQKYYEKLTKGDKIVSSVVDNVSFSANEEVKKINYPADKIDKKSDRGDDNLQENISSFSSGSNSSQSHERFVNRHLNAVCTTRTAGQNLIRFTSPESTTRTDPHNSSHGSITSLYKFKNQIRERFEHSSMGSMRSAKRKLKLLSSSSSNSSLLSYPSEDRENGSRPIPIFALHPGGSFYVPLTVDSHLLAPFITELNGNHGLSSPLFHPVTISVNFNRTSPSTLLKPTICTHRYNNYESVGEPVSRIHVRTDLGGELDKITSQSESGRIYYVDDSDHKKFSST